MGNFFSAIIGFLSSVGTFFQNFLEGILSFFYIIPQSLSFLTYIESVIPGELLAFMSAGVAICLIYHIIGR